MSRKRRSRDRISRKTRGRLLAVVSAVLFGVAVVMLAPNNTVIHVGTEGAVPLLVLCVALLIGLAARRLTDGASDVQDTGVFDSLQVEEATLPRLEADARLREEIYAETVRQYDGGEVAALVTVMADPKKHIVRTTENLELLSVRIRRHVLREVELPDSLHHLPFPVLRRTKGDLLDELGVEIDEKQAATLSYRRSIGISMLVLRETYKLATTLQEGIERDRMLAGVSSVVTAPSGFGASAAYRELEARARASLGADVAHNQRFLAMLRFMADNYFVFVEMPGNAAVPRLIAATYSERYDDSVTRFAAEARSFLGLALLEYEIGLQDALWSRSYHMRCAAPDATYVHRLGYELKLEDAGPNPPPVAEETPVGAGEVRDATDPELRFTPTLGSTIVHLYARNISRDALRRVPKMRDVTSGADPSQGLVLKVRLLFKARPPGLLAPMAFFSCYLAALTTLVLLKYDAIFEPQKSAPLAR